MSRVFVDTSAILALVNPEDAHHAAAVKTFDRLQRADAALVTTSVVLVEVNALLARRMGREAVRHFRREGFTTIP